MGDARITGEFGTAVDALLAAAASTRNLTVLFNPADPSVQFNTAVSSAVLYPYVLSGMSTPTVPSTSSVAQSRVRI